MFEECESSVKIVDVYIQTSFTKILDIDTVNQRFQAEAIIESKWYDPSITNLNQKIDINLLWKPDLYVENAIGDIKTDVSYKLIKQNRKNSSLVENLDDNVPLVLVCELRKVCGTFYERLELEDFPLDIQDLTIIVATRKPGCAVNFHLLQKELKVLTINNILDQSMWKVHNILMTSKFNIHREYSFGSRDYPAFKLSAKVFRNPGYYYLNVILPILLVNIASLSSFSLQSPNDSNRLMLSATMLLTSVGIRWTIGNFMPSVSYLTSLDKYSLSSLLIITMVLLYHAIAISVKATKYLPNLIAFICFCVILLIKHLIFVRWIINVRKYRMRVLKKQEIRRNSDHGTHISSVIESDRN